MQNRMKNFFNFILLLLFYLYIKVTIMKYSRILLKLSGESLAGKGSHGINESILEEYASQVIEAVNKNCEVAVVIGGGNIFRGLSGTESGFDRVKGDQMGMLATVINSLALESAVKRLGGKATVFTSIRMEPVGELYNRDKVLEEMKKIAEHIRRNETAERIKDAFGQERDLQLGIPCSDSSRIMLDVSPTLAVSIITAHIATKEAEMVEANEQAKIELGMQA